ncbi:hypothetical protein [Natronococcus sp. A-GB7]|uniref:DUF7501 family protein n=1 Tax=Natronococcus sp. A-GB7 TaxID=3037649 RepID=UPI00241FABA9|nr:hypothetical protein [Natronococcus sp. A-GB7]MDG5818099.1 hypothetical protein [Natronococcus sp. A-GB7]
MGDHTHPSRDSSQWDNPDFCPFCSQPVSDGGPGFMDHIDDDENATCRDRFEQWRDGVADDMNGEWGG